MNKTKKTVELTLPNPANEKTNIREIFKKYPTYFLIAPFWRVGEGSKFPVPYWSRISAAISPLYERIPKKVIQTLCRPQSKKPSKAKVKSEVGKIHPVF
jgi:hypothetical protein